MPLPTPSMCRVPGPPRLLLVDDNPDNLEIVAMMLAGRYDVVACGSATGALAVVEAAEPDLLVLDIAMAPLDGISCLKAIRAIPRYAAIPAIALTALARDVERDTFLAAGFHAVVTKPILDLRELEQVIAGVLAQTADRLDRSEGITA